MGVNGEQRKENGGQKARAPGTRFMAADLHSSSLTCATDVRDPNLCTSVNANERYHHAPEHTPDLREKCTLLC